MSLLSQLSPDPKSKKKSIRVGRGRSSKRGSTSGKGHKGQKARSGFSLKRGFEGGQMPLSRRLPKFGFNNKNFKTSYEIVNIKQLEKAFKDKQEVSSESLKKKGLILSTKRVKILGSGELKKSLEIKVHKVSRSAQKAIESSGGKVQVIS